MLDALVRADRLVELLAQLYVVERDLERARREPEQVGGDEQRAVRGDARPRGAALLEALAARPGEAHEGVAAGAVDRRAGFERDAVVLRIDPPQRNTGRFLHRNDE